jgi:hypothetical protein
VRTEKRSLRRDRRWRAPDAVPTARFGRCVAIGAIAVLALGVSTAEPGRAAEPKPDPYAPHATRTPSPDPFPSSETRTSRVPEAGAPAAPSEAVAESEPETARSAPAKTASSPARDSSGAPETTEPVPPVEAKPSVGYVPRGAARPSEPTLPRGYGGYEAVANAPTMTGGAVAETSSGRTVLLAALALLALSLASASLLNLARRVVHRGSGA